MQRVERFIAPYSGAYQLPDTYDATDNEDVELPKKFGNYPTGLYIGYSDNLNNRVELVFENGDRVTFRDPEGGQILPVGPFKTLGAETTSDWWALVFLYHK